MDEYHTPYSYVGNDPINRLDPDGTLTEFRDQNGNLLPGGKVNDGSNAVFKLNADPTGVYKPDNVWFEFAGYSDQGGIDKVNAQTVMDFSQEYFLGTLVCQLQPNGSWKTFCNVGLRAVIHSVSNAMSELGYESVIPLSQFDGIANQITRNIQGNYSQYEVPLNEVATRATASQAIIFAVQDRWPSIGHVATMRRDGNVNNIGWPSETGNVVQDVSTFMKNHSTAKWYELQFTPKK